MFGRRRAKRTFSQPGPMTMAAAVLLLMAAIATPAFATQRVALVIGNAAYKHVPLLANPLNDMADIGAALGRLGFTVTRIENADKAGLERGLQEFKRTVSGSEIAMIFFAGHGIEIGGRNFLVPVDAKLETDQDIDYETVPLDLVMKTVEGASGLGLVILDACRDNPFAKSMKQTDPTRSVGRGLARPEPSGEILVAYAAEHRTKASDGTGRNSPYSKALLRYLEEPELEVQFMFRKVRDAVLKDTGGRQKPFEYGSLSSKRIYLGPKPKETAGAGTIVKPGGSKGDPPPPPPGDTAARAYEAAERANTIHAYRLFGRKFAGTYYAGLAQENIRKLEAAAAAREAALGLTARDRGLIQSGLTALGYDPGPADGVFRLATRAALKAWQAKTSVAATGWLTAAASRALRAAAAKAEAPDELGRTRLHVAAQEGMVDMVKALIDAGADIEARDKNGWTPLHFAAEQGRTETAKFLIDAKANIEAWNEYHDTPLLLAAQEGRTETAKLLIDAGANTGVWSKGGYTPLHIAAFYGKPEMAKLLMGSEADIEARDEDGWTPLHIAAKEGQAAVVIALLDAGADGKARTKDGETPYDLAHHKLRGTAGLKRLRAAVPE